MFSMRWGDIIIDINMAFFQLLETSNFHDTVHGNDENKRIRVVSGHLFMEKCGDKG